MRTLLLLLTIVTSSCGWHGPAASAPKGAPHDFDLICGSEQDGPLFLLFEGQGKLQRPEMAAADFSCSRLGATNTPAATAQWSCVERREGPDRLHLDVAVQGGRRLASLSVEQAEALPRTLLATLQCY